MKKRYIKQHESGSDWSVIDTFRGNIPIATGLDSSEADETIANKEKENEDA